MSHLRAFATFFAVAFVALASLAPVAAAEEQPPVLDGSCVTVRPGVTACGVAVVSFPSTGAGTGVATGIVDWQLTVVSQSCVRDSPVVPGPAFAMVTVGCSMTRDCAYAVLRADGITVATSDTLCWDI